MDSEDSDQPARMRSLIRVFAGRTCNLVENAVSQFSLNLLLSSNLKKQPPEFIAKDLTGFKLSSKRHEN